ENGGSGLADTEIDMSQALTQSQVKQERRSTSGRDLYSYRRLADGYPGLDRLAFDRFSQTLDEHGDETPRLEALMRRLDRLVNLDRLKNVAVIGCGPKPQTIKFLSGREFNVVGVEPVPLFVESARE